MVVGYDFVHSPDIKSQIFCFINQPRGNGLFKEQASEHRARLTGEVWEPRCMIASAANFVHGGFRQKISTVGIFLYFKAIERSDVPVGSIQLGNIR